ncbi:MAG TPA: 2-phospho-L-lactate guanylyltransferase [Chloroflexota bacterium]|nr:2-phospho-L-lactate guanylyltransferase [Chloroflexota bacterium]
MAAGVSLIALIPAKGLAAAKSRLAPAFSPAERAEVSRHMLRSLLSQVMQLAELDACAVISAGEQALEEARQAGAMPLPEATAGLNKALEAGRAWAVGQGASSLLVILSDLPLASLEDLRELLSRRGQAPVVLAPSKDGGTNALLLTPPEAIPFRFGRDSARYHCFEAERHGLPVALVERDGLAFDVDTPEDLRAYRAVQAGRLQLSQTLAPAAR